MRAIFWLVVCSVLASACAAPRTQRIRVDENAARSEARLQNELALEGLLNDDLRLQRVAFELKRKAVAQCGTQVKPGWGIYALHRDMVPEELQGAASSRYLIGPRLRVLATYPGSSGEQAGLLPGDEILAINQWTLPEHENPATPIRGKIEEFLKTGKPLALKVARGEERLELTLTPRPECAFPVILHESDALNAFADGKNVLVTRGMMRFAQDDTELALVVAHEMAHNTMQHMKSKTANYILGTIVDVLIMAKTGANTQGAFGNLAGNAYSQEFEAEADYVGMYIMAAAGKDIDNAPKFWRRMAAAHPRGIKAGYSATHPSTAYRLLALEQTVTEIRAKQASRAALAPQMKPPAPPPAAGPIPAAQAMMAPAGGEARDADAVSGQFLGKEMQERGLAALARGIAIRFSLSNKGEREIVRVGGKIRLYDAAGQEVGTVAFRSDARIAPHGSAELTQNVYPLLFAGYGKLKALEQENVRAEFAFDTIEFADGASPGR